MKNEAELNRVEEVENNAIEEELSAIEVGSDDVLALSALDSEQELASGENILTDEELEFGGVEDVKELFHTKPKTQYDGVKALWSEVLFLAAEYAMGKVTNDHDCGGSKELLENTKRSSIRFLCGKGNFELACEAAGIDAGSIQKLGRRCQHQLRGVSV
jgi:hypothetical protein